MQRTEISGLEGGYCHLEQLIRLQVYVRSFSLRIKSPSSASYSGDNMSKIRGRGINFEEVRHYQAGDDVRNIDWRVTARTQKTHTKIFTEEKEQPVFLLIDQRLSMFFGSHGCYKSVMAAQLGAMIAWAALQDNDRVGGLVFNSQQHTEIKPRKHRNAVLKLLKEIERYNNYLKHTPNKAEQNLSFDDMLMLCSKAIKPGTRIFILSDFSGFSEQSQKLIQQLSRHHQIFSCLIHDRLETELPETGSFTVSNGNQIIRIENGDRKIRQVYRDAWQEKISSLEALHRKNRIFFDKAESADNPYQILSRCYASGNR